MRKNGSTLRRKSSTDGCGVSIAVLVVTSLAGYKPAIQQTSSLRYDEKGGQVMRRQRSTCAELSCLIPLGDAFELCFICVEVVGIEQNALHARRKRRLGEKLGQVIDEMGAALFGDAVELGLFGQLEKHIFS